MNQPARRCMLAVFAHPDDETSAAAGTFIQYAREGVDIHVVTATRGERGDLGTGDLTIERRDLPAVREAELRAVLALYGANQPILLDYRDQELITADFATLTQDVLRAIASVRPDVVINFGPSVISEHADSGMRSHPRTDWRRSVPCCAPWITFPRIEWSGSI